MRRIFIEAMQQRGFDVIGQVRIDTRLYDEPPRKKKGQRGRPRKYGEKYTPKRLAHLKRTEVTLKLYGKEQTVRHRSKVLKARFLDGRLVRAVWCEFQSDSGKWKSASLLLSTDTTLSAEQVIKSYGLRWSIESMFNTQSTSWGRLSTETGLGHERSLATNTPNAAPLGAHHYGELWLGATVELLEQHRSG